MSLGMSIVGISSAVPKNILNLESLGESYGNRYVKKVSMVTGIHSVRVAENGKTAADYCIAAAENLFDKMSYNRSEIDALVFVSQSPDYMVPHTSAIMQHRLGLSNRVAAFDLNYGCPGFVYGLFQAYSLINSGFVNKVLLCCGDTMTNKINPQDKALRMVMGDGGSAIILEKSDNVENVFKFYTDGSRAEKLMVKAGAARLPVQIGLTDVVTTDEDGNSRSLENLYMDGIEVMNFALKDVATLINEVLDSASWNKDMVDKYLFHQANALIVQYLAKKLGLPVEKTPIGVDGIGNTSSASIPVMLCKNYGENRCVDFGKTVICGFGTGLSAVAIAMPVNNVYISELIEI